MLPLSEKIKQNKFAIVIAIILFIIPFFWLKPGEMNLGGDSGRLYFYDPYSYLTRYIIYSIATSGVGVENFAFASLPFTCILLLFKLIFTSPTILIDIFTGIVLSAAFLSVYFIIKELLSFSENNIKESSITYSSILAGFLYIFSQISIYSGWENPLLTHNQIFLNPLMFLIFLRYFLTKKILYIFFASLISLIYAANFSASGAPPFFAFYPLTLVFLMGYIKFIRKLSIPYKEIIFGIILFLLLHSFHLIPEATSLFSSGSSLNNNIFVQEGTSSRDGLNYFTAVASSVKLSLIWLGVAQFQQETIYSIFSIFPIIFILGFYFNKGKTLLLTGLFFLIAMYFTSANITGAGLFLYEQLFKIPGFSMFRNYHGQWLYVYFFFFVLLFGQSFSIVLDKLSNRLSYIALFIYFSVIVGFGVPLITGVASIVTHKETGLRYAFRMDPLYEKVLDYFKNYPIDSKIMSFPLTGPGYQILQGKDGGFYQGLPTISYLTGKSDFSGFESLKPFDGTFLEAIKNKNYDALNRILAIMNIKQIFYNSDPFIYESKLQGYLYDYVSKFNPKDQNEYKAFVENIPHSDRIDFGDKYHIYSIESSSFLPHIFTTSEEIYTNDTVELSINPYFSSDSRMTPIFTNLADENSSSILYAAPDSGLFLIKNNVHLHRHEPFISVQLDNPMYRFVLLKEKYELFKVRNNPTQYLSLNLFFLSKRMFEVVRFADEMPVLKASWEEPKMWEVYKFNAFNSWEASFARYEQGMNEIIAWVENSNRSEAAKGADRIKINEQLFKHEIDLLRSVRNSQKKNDKKVYLYSLVEDTFKRLFQRVNIPLFTPSEYTYSIPNYLNREGDYELYINKKDIVSSDFTNTVISIGNENLKPLPVNNADSPYLVKFNSLYLGKNIDLKPTVLIPGTNVVKDLVWNNSGKQELVNGLVTLTVNNSIDENTTGLMANIPAWIEGKKYLISFDYLTFGDDFIFSFRDKKKSDDEIKKFSYQLFFEKKLNSTEWKTHQSLVSAEKNSIEAFLQISGFPPKNTSKMQIKNVSITEIQFPQILFRKIVTKTERHNPKIQFTKINPTKYKIDVVNVDGPYRLVFLESFNQNWKLIDPATKNDSIKGSIARFVSKILGSATSVFVPDRNEFNTVTAEYFNGEVKEGNHRNAFLEKSTFETWGMLHIAESTHAEVMGYANTWFITPEDMNGKTEYTLILEMRTQKQFYLALVVSILALILLTLYIVRSGFRRHAKNN